MGRFAPLIFGEAEPEGQVVGDQGLVGNGREGCAVVGFDEGAGDGVVGWSGVGGGSGGKGGGEEGESEGEGCSEGEHFGGRGWS